MSGTERPKAVGKERCGHRPGVTVHTGARHCPRWPALLLACASQAVAAETVALPYTVVDTNQTRCYSDRAAIPCPDIGKPFAGQDGNYTGHAPHYRDNGDGTVTDLVTGLMWEKGFQRASFADAPAIAAKARTGGHTDWRVPSTKELYSLIDFSGSTGSSRPESASVPRDAKPYLDTRAFDFEYPSSPRFIDAQYLTSTAYRGLTMGREQSFFGVNFADGRIKGYPQSGGPGGRTWYLRLVRGNPAYGRNDFVENGNGTVADRATGLTWMQADSGDGAFRKALANTARGDGSLDWGEALAFCSGLEHAGRSDWRLPNAKELHTLVDYSRSPSATQSPAIAPLFRTTAIRDPEGQPDYPYFWSSTTHLDGPGMADFAVYIAFGKAQGHVSPQMRQHGAAGMGPGGMGGPPPGGMNQERMGGPPPRGEAGGMGGPPPGGMNQERMGGPPSRGEAGGMGGPPPGGMNQERMGGPPPRGGAGGMDGPPPGGINQGRMGGPPPRGGAGDMGGPPPDGMGGPMGGFPPGATGAPPQGGPGWAGGPGRGFGPEMGGELRLLDVHGAGAQRSSPKSGDESRLPKGAGPQGDVLRIYNYARCVAGG